LEKFSKFGEYAAWRKISKSKSAIVSRVFSTLWGRMLSCSSVTDLFPLPLQAIGNYLLCHSKLTCKFHLSLARILIQNLLQLLVFYFYWLTRAFTILKVESSLSKLLEPFFTCVERYSFYPKLNKSFLLLQPRFFFL